MGPEWIIFGIFLGVIGGGVFKDSQYHPQNNEGEKHVCVQKQISNAGTSVSLEQCWEQTVIRESETIKKNGVEVQ